MSGWEVLYQAVLLAASLVLAATTWVLAKETRLLRRAQTDPRLSVWIEPEDREIHWIDMVIENVGGGPAYSITFAPSRDFELQKGEPLSRLGFMSTGLPYLAPRQRIRFFLTNLLDDFEPKMRSPFDIEVFYRSADNTASKETFRIDFSPLRNLPAQAPSRLGDIAEKLEDIKRAIAEATARRS